MSIFFKKWSNICRKISKGAEKSAGKTVEEIQAVIGGRAQKSMNPISTKITIPRTQKVSKRQKTVKCFR